MFTGGSRKKPLDHLHLVCVKVPAVLLETKFLILKDGATTTDRCHHNSLHELDIDLFKWSLCINNPDNGPMMKQGCGMVAIHQALLVVGGKGSLRKKSQLLAQYDKEGFIAGFARTNEHHLHKLGTGELRSVKTCALCVCVCACRMFVYGWWMVEGWRMIEW